MTTQDFHHKLTAILNADVVSYSRLIREDEEGTVRTLTAYRDLMSDLIQGYKGRVVDSPGDNLLAEFGSVRDAVYCAVEIQKELQIKNSELPENRKMRFRIGINTGDVIQDGDRIYGDGVNLAARIESLADAGGICLSRSAYDQVKRKTDIQYEYVGEHEVKNIDEPVRVYKVLMDCIQEDVLRKEKSEEPALIERKTSPLSEKPSIVVLPFINMSSDPEQEYFSDGMSEEIIGALAKLEGLKVISRTSAFFFKGKDVDLRTIGEKLGVENVLEGSVRKAGNRIRISAQLIKVNDDTHLWADTYDRELEDVFTIQDEISHAVIENLKLKLLGLKAESFIKDYSKSTEAYELFLKGRYFFEKDLVLKAIESFKEAIKADPAFAPAYSSLAINYIVYGIGFSSLPNEMWPKVKTLTLKALEMDEMDPIAHMSMASIKAGFEYDWKGSEISIKRSIELNPGLSQAYIGYSAYLIGVGRTDEAVEKMKHALELDPLSISNQNYLSLALYFDRKYDQSIAQSQKTLEMDPENPNTLLYLGAGFSAVGRYEESLSLLNKLENTPLLTTFLCHLYSLAGQKEESQRVLDDILERSKHEFFPPILIGGIYGRLGDMDKAFEWLEKGFEDHDPQNWCIKVDPMYDNVRTDPRWADLMKKMNLTD